MRQGRQGRQQLQEGQQTQEPQQGQGTELAHQEIDCKSHKLAQSRWLGSDKIQNHQTISVDLLTWILIQNFAFFLGSLCRPFHDQAFKSISSPQASSVIPYATLLRFLSVSCNFCKSRQGLTCHKKIQHRQAQTFKTISLPQASSVIPYATLLKFLSVSCIFCKIIKS